MSTLPEEATPSPIRTVHIFELQLIIVRSTIYGRGLFCQFVIWSLVQGKLWGLVTIYRSLVVSARRSFDTGWIAWERGPQMKKWMYMALGRSLRGSFRPGTTVVELFIGFQNIQIGSEKKADKFMLIIGFHSPSSLPFTSFGL